ncbi:MAG: glycosyltransferase family 39 protein [Deltaproteobacteria bacterium]|nr:glycosyltransferase family 39 protein [Deltaproteobacteria bacterium]
MWLLTSVAAIDLRMDFVGRRAETSHCLDLARKDDELELWMLRRETAALSVVAGFALIIRIYLCLTSYCISGDGVAYLVMARHFAEGQWRAALDAVYSPLYPLLISLTHRLIADWEMAGDLLSAILGTAAVATTYLMTREAFGRRDLGLGAAVLMALHPEIAAYSASVRTEAGYIFLTTGACWLLLKSLNNRRVAVAASGGMVAGLAYLYRTEAIGFLPLGILLFLAAGWLWKQDSRTWVFTAACVFAIAFMMVAAPYIAYLRISTGHWSIGREFTAAMMYGMGDVASNGGEWQRLGWSATTSPLTIIFDDPRLYAEKVGQYFVVSIYNFAQALEPLLMVLLAIGIWARGRALFTAPRETFLAAIVLFYFCGFALSYTGTRFMLHLIPFVFGWVAAGIIVLSKQVAQWHRPGSSRIVHAVVPVAIALILLPQTLWPIGYDMRGVRYAGEDIAKMTKGPVTVAARDGRVAYYAGARLIQLPPSPPDNVCGWLRSHDGDFLMIGNHDEHAFNVTPTLHCLKLLKRYPRYRSGYYDLYAVKPLEPARRSSTAIEAQ